MPLDLTPTDVARFWVKVDVRGPDDCWPWLAGCFGNGYGAFKLGLRQVRAHRVAYKLAHPEWDETSLVCHHCDNPPCQNERHFFIGTHADNHADRNRKGRQAKGETHGSRTHPELTPHGSENGMAKLSESDVPTIFLLAADGLSNSEIGRRYGVSHQTIRQILLRLIWTHVPLPVGKVRADRDPRHKLSAQQAQEIRELKGQMSQTAIAKQYGVAQTTISKIHRGLFVRYRD